MRAAGLAVVLALALQPASAAVPKPAPVAVDGWWQTSVAGLPGPANPLVPAGGLNVAQGLLGPAAVSALRVPAAPGDVVLVTLVLAETATSPTVALLACPTTTAWTPVAGGDLTAAPTVDCTSSVVGKVTDGTVTWSFGPSFVRAGFLDVGLVPVDGAQPFSAPFAPPGPTAVAVSHPQAAPPPAPLPPPARTAPPQARTAPPQEPPTYVVVQPPTAQLSVPPSMAPVPPVIAITSAAPSAAAHPVVVASAGHTEGPVPRNVAWTLLVALVLATAVTALRQRAVRFGEAPVRGVGHLARPHPEPAPRL